MSSAFSFQVISPKAARRWIAATCTVALLAGCDDSGKFAFPSMGQKTEGAATAPATAGPTVEREVESPDVFSSTDQGVWDGRPSLGGVWVAHPDVQDPERVIIRNQTNGKFVIGALFKREADLAGPKLQISSDAAASLGIAAGAATQLNVTALRREAVPVDAADLPVEAAIETPVEVTATTLDPVPAVTPVAVPKPAPKPAPKASTLDKPFIQIGIFSVEANANRAAKQMVTAGMSAAVKRQEIKNKPFWRVLVGPAATSAERKRLLAKIKTEGFTDAYAVTN